MEKDEKRGWSPYLGGGLAGLLSILSVWVVGKYFGASTTFVRSAGMIESIVGPERIAKMSYFIKEAPQIDWQWMFLIGILIGSLIASITSGTIRWKGVPEMWEKRFGPSRLKRGVAAFLGGVKVTAGIEISSSTSNVTI